MFGIVWLPPHFDFKIPGYSRTFQDKIYVFPGHLRWKFQDISGQITKKSLNFRTFQDKKTGKNPVPFLAQKQAHERNFNHFTRFLQKMEVGDLQ